MEENSHFIKYNLASTFIILYNTRLNLLTDVAYDSKKIWATVERVSGAVKYLNLN